MPRESKIVSVKLENIRTDVAVAGRAELDKSTKDNYAEAWRNGAEFPPVILFSDGKSYWIGDGWHRVCGAIDANIETLYAEVWDGNERDAILFAVGANSKHGRPRSRADKRRCIETLLDDGEWGLRSKNWIAQACNVSHHTVEEVIAERGSQVSRRQASDGRSFPAQTARGEGRAARGEPAAETEEDDGDVAALPVPAEIIDVDKDALGKPIPKKLKDTFGDTIYDAASGQLEQIRLALKTTFKTNKYILYEELCDHVESLLAILRNSKPHCVHQGCKGLGCSGCKGLGWMPEWRVEEERLQELELA